MRDSLVVIAKVQKWEKMDWNYFKMLREGNKTDKGVKHWRNAWEIRLKN